MNVSIIPFKRVESIKDEWEELSKNQTIFNLMNGMRII